MARYIDIDKLISSLKIKSQYENNQRIITTWANALECFIDILEDGETEDVAPVVHAHWIHPINSDLKIWVCSNCGGEERNSFKREFGSYCSYCGAKMDEDYKEG